MPTCIIIALVVTCTTPLTSGPAEAAAILAPYQFRPIPRIEIPIGGRGYILPSKPGSGPFGPFKPSPPRKRLDGTLLTSLPQILGLPAYHPYNMYRNYGVVMPQVTVVAP